MSKHLILNSRGGNYYDYMDMHFDSPHFSPPGTPTWYRNSRVFPDRTECYRTLERFDIPTPIWGLVKRLKLPNANPKTLIVVYTDELSHQGYGKELMSLHQANEKYPDCLCVEYVYSVDFYSNRMSIGKGGDGISRRYLMIGESAWELEYRSQIDWRSNVGEVDIDVLGPLKDDTLKMKMIDMMKEYRSPIFALDVVPESEERWLCTDLNLAPGMDNVGMKEFVGPKQASDLIKDFYHKYCVQT